MKKLSIIALLACALFTTSCGNEPTLDETRVADVEAPTVAISELSVKKADVAFTLTSTAGNPAAREIGVMVSTEAQPTAENSEAFAADAEGKVAVSLAPGTKYYAVAYALTANKLVTGEVKSFETESHPLGAFLGAKNFIGGNLLQEAYTETPITIVADETDETVAYLTGLQSEQVALGLGTVKLVFDVANNKVTIPEGQIIAESKYGDFQYVGLDDETNPITGDIVGTIEDGKIKFPALAVLIVKGGNAGLFHAAFIDITIE